MTTRRQRSIQRLIESWEHQNRIAAQIADAAFLDTFLALPPAERASRWRMLDEAAKFRLVARAMERRCGTWLTEAVLARIAEWDERYGPSPVEAAVAGALERLAESHQQSAETAETPEERTYFKRWAGAFRKALLYWQQGVRPERTPGGAYLIASATRAGQVHRVSRDGQCSCEAQNRGCWHAALVTGLETGYEDLDSGIAGERDEGEGDDTDADEDISIQIGNPEWDDDDAAAQRLWTRIAAARAAYAEAA